MKLILILSFTIFVADSKSILPSVVAAWNKLVVPVMGTCIEETKVDAETAKNMFNKDVLPKEEEMRCYFKCLDEKLGFDLPDGNFDKEVMIKKLDYLTPEIADKCLDKFNSEKDRCMKSYRIAICIIVETLVD